MRLAVLDGHRPAVVTGEGPVDVTGALPWPHDPDPLTAGWWRRLCRDFSSVRDDLARGAEKGPALGSPRMLAPAVNPSKIIACAGNYAEHVAEMHAVQERTLGRVGAPWMFDFDVFLKAPSSLSGPADDIVLPPEIVARHEIHHESELVVVIGRGGKDIPEAAAPDHVLGYTVGLDITVRGPGDRSRRKSHDTFSPLGPWIVTADEVGDPGDLDIRLAVNDEERQAVHTSTMLTGVPAIVAHASRAMTLLPGDLIFTGAPPGVGPIYPGDRLEARISRIGALHLTVR